VVILLRLAKLGVTARADRGRLHLHPASAIPPDLMAALRKHKAAVLALLADTAGLRALEENVQRVGLQRPPSWSDAATVPEPGWFCACCRGYRWWCEAAAPKGWRCTTCHPAGHLPPDAVTIVSTTTIVITTPMATTQTSQALQEGTATPLAAPRRKRLILPAPTAIRKWLPT
jgi:hypothetical protein